MKLYLHNSHSSSQVPDDANFAPSDITWTFQAGDATPVEQEQIINSEIGVVTFDNTTSILTIKSVTADTVVSLLLWDVPYRYLHGTACT